MPRFAANLSMLFTEHALLDRFAAARDAGFEAVEIQFPYELAPDRLAEARARAGVDLVLFNVPAADLLAGGDGLACVPGREQAFCEALASALVYARELCPRAVNVLAGRVPTGVPRARCLAAFATNLAGATDAFAALGITTTVEALNDQDMPHFLLGTHDDVLEVIAAAAAAAPSGSRATVQYDVYHQLRMGRDPYADLARDGARMGHIQIADVPGRGAPGTGTVVWDAMFRAIDASGYEGWVGAEYRPVGATVESLDWLRRART